MTDKQAPVSQETTAVLVIFGITGDLAKRKVLPAVYHLFKDNLLPEHTQIVGTSRRALSNQELLEQVELCVLEVDNVCDPAALQRFQDNLHMLQLNPVNDDDYDKLRETLDSIDASQGQALNRLFYLSVPPQVYGPIISRLGEHGLNAGGEQGGSRLLVEKPFGYDINSARRLIDETATIFQEDQIFRIDHYLAKETAQNILTFRRHNPLFSSVWDGQHITSVEVMAAEQIGIEGRANFYDSVGALRDLVQSHLLQLLTLTLMDLPADPTDNNQLHNCKQAFLEALEPIAADEVAKRVIRAQYGDYRAEVDNQDSTTETFVSVELYSHLPKWHGVPLRLTTGKELAAKQTVITVCFGTPATDINQLTFRLQPNEGIDVQLLVKKPGYTDDIQPADMNFSYATSFQKDSQPAAYERVLVDAVRGDKALFATSEEVIASWQVLQPILDAWARSSDDLRLYSRGSEAAAIINQT